MTCRVWGPLTQARVRRRLKSVTPAHLSPGMPTSGRLWDLAGLTQEAARITEHQTEQQNVRPSRHGDRLTSDPQAEESATDALRDSDGLSGLPDEP